MTVILEDISKLFENLKNQVVLSKSSEEVLKDMFSAMSAIDQKKFVLDNLLESLKKGDDPSTVLKVFKDIGIYELETVPNNPGGNENYSKGLGKLLYSIRRLLGGAKFAAACAAKKLTKSINIGLDNGFPSISLEGSNIDDITDFISEAYFVYDLKQAAKKDDQTK